MAIGIVLAARYSTGSILRKRTPQRLLDEIGRWWARATPDLDPETEIEVADEGSECSVLLHPAAEPVVFEVPEPGTLVVTATTSFVGPGYHAKLVDGLKAMARDLDITWAMDQAVEGLGDDTGYFETGDGKRLEQEFAAWAQALAREVVRAADEEATSLHLGMDPSHWFVTSSFAVTPLGPRDRSTFEQLAADPLRANELHAWWNAEMDAQFHLNRALVRMWCHVTWRPPLDDGERRTLERVDVDLRRAKALGAETLPEDAWAEVRRYLEDPAATASTSPATLNAIGYRRGSMRVSTGGWMLELPGSLLESADGGDYHAYDADRSVRLSAYAQGEVGATTDPHTGLVAFGPPSGRPRAVIDEPDLMGWAGIADGTDGADEHLVLQGSVFAPERVALVTITCRTADEAWAVSTFLAIRPAQETSFEEDLEAAGPELPGATHTPRAVRSWNVDLLMSAVGKLRSAEPGSRPFFVVDAPSGGYVQASLGDGGSVHTEAAGAGAAPAVANADSQTARRALGWAEASEQAAGNHVRDWATGSDAEIAKHLLESLERLYEQPPNELILLSFDEG